MTKINTPSMTDRTRLTDEEIATVMLRSADASKHGVEGCNPKHIHNDRALLCRYITQLRADLRACEAERGAATQECELLEQEKNDLEDDVEPLNQEISLLKETIDQLTIDLKRTGWKTIWQLENESCDRAVFIDSKGNSWMSPIELGDFNKPDGASKARLYYVIPTPPPLPEE